MIRDFASLQNRHFDLLVCGGGVYGAWTAYDAALRGLKVVIVEQGDWANATSSASSKLIHGGLRYLETYDFKLVSKSLKERKMLLHTAPHRVWPLRFGVPIYTHQRMNRLQLKLGLALYDFLAGDTDPEMRHSYLNQGQFTEHFPLLNEHALKGG
ncbi:MAG: FAD-dependent oxidoreductase, partial [Pseudomonadota bacterium]